MTYRPYSSILSAITSSSTKSRLSNDSGLTILQFMPVKLTTTGGIARIDVSVDVDVLGIVGISEEMIPTGSEGFIVTQGKIENIGSFSFGDYIYVSKTGGLTNVLPSEGVDGFLEGDWVVKVGVVGKNENNPSIMDLFIGIQIVGKL